MTRRYVANVVRRARDEIIRAVLFATRSPEVMEELELRRRLASVTHEEPGT